MLTVVTTVLAGLQTCNHLKQTYSSLECCDDSPLNVLGADSASVTQEPCPITISTTLGPVSTGANDAQGCVYLGMLNDYSGPFKQVSPAVELGQRMFWKRVNENGGITGSSGAFSVAIKPGVDTGYNPTTHATAYETIRTDSFALALSLGTYQTMEIMPKLVEDSMLAVPLSWWSGWSDESSDNNLILESGADYRKVAANLVEYFLSMESTPTNATFGFAGIANDYGQDTLAGVRAALDRHGLNATWEYLTPLFNVADVLQKPQVDYLILAVFATQTTQIVGGLAGSMTKFGLPQTAFNQMFMNTALGPVLTARSVVASSVAPYSFDTEAHDNMRATLPQGVQGNYYAMVAWASQYPLYTTLQALADSGLELTRENHKLVGASQTVDSDGMMDSYILNHPRGEGVVIQKPTSQGMIVLSKTYHTG